LYNYIDVDTFD